MKFFKVLPNENLKSAYKRQVLQQCCRSAILLKRDDSIAQFDDSSPSVT